MLTGTTCAAIWRRWADGVEGHDIDCGHYLAEEAPAETLASLKDFLARTIRSLMGDDPAVNGAMAKPLLLKFRPEARAMATAPGSSP